MIGYRIKYKNIISELYLPENGNGTTFIFLPGLPSYLGKNQVAKEFTEAGFTVFQPFYSGSFDSAGSFSPSQCVADVKTFLEMAKQTAHEELYFNASLKIRTERIILGGTSFGGSIAGITSPDKDIYGIFLINPVLEYGVAGGFGKKEGVNLLRLIKNAYPFTYRIEDFSEWNAFFSKKDALTSPIQFLSKQKKPLWIIQGKQDTTTPLSVSLKLLEKNLSADQYEFLSIPNASHSISSFPNDTWSKIAKKINETSF